MDKNMQILVVDDFSTMRRIVKNVLRELGFNNIKEAEDGKAALQVLRSSKIDFIVTDWNMPVMDGLTLVKWVKASPKLGNMPIIVITSAGNPAKESQLLELGAHRVISKPISPPVMKDALQDFLD